MHLPDILRLSLSALAQQKLRTLLTTLGVLFGSFVLAFSVSLYRGVQETVVREYLRYGTLRQIDVTARQTPFANSGSEDKIEVRGIMSEEKRRRLRRALFLRRPADSKQIAPSGLTPEKLQRLAAIPHVTLVRPDVYINGRVLLNSKAEAVGIHNSSSDHRDLVDRVVAGTFLHGDSEDQVVVTEFLLYRLGIADDAAVAAALGQKLRIEYQVGAVKPDTLLMLFNAFRSNNPLIARDFTIVGVIRGTSPEDRPNRNWLDWWIDYSEVIVSTRAGTELFFASPSNQQAGLNRVMVEVDHPDSVREATEALSGMGLQTRSMVELIEREQFTYLVLLGGMTCIAGVALLVAALGIINTMLMSVLERTREIGVMKAVGARNSHIQAIFLVEGALIGISGGVLGLLASWIVSFPSDAWMRSMVSERMKLELQESLFVWPPWVLLGGPFLACLVTTLAAVYPARRAARVNPIAALRHE